MVKTNWHDVDQIGREIRRNMKDMNTKYHKATNMDEALIYYDAYLRAVKAITPYIEMYTGVEKIIRAGSKLEAIIQR